MIGKKNKEIIINHKWKDDKRWRRLRISKEELEKFSLNFSKGANYDIIPFTVELQTMSSTKLADNWKNEEINKIGKKG